MTVEAIAETDIPTPPPVVRSVTVKADIDKAFHRFTNEMRRWWPLASHSISGAAADNIIFPARVGDAIAEYVGDRQVATWGRLLVRDAPHRLVFTWHPDQAEAEAQDVEVRFEAVNGGTLVTLRQSGFERSGTDAAKLRKAYNIGWIYVLGLYAAERSLRMLALAVLTKVITVFARLSRRSQKR